ncbi:MAG: alpha/beta fold hydrolase [Deltaproteobacteria bacterium]|nr:alpha/beta fold hydrolase [Deltaproteobacteria bacterium]
MSAPALGRHGRLPLLAALLLLCGCAAPFGVKHTSPKAVYRTLHANVLSSGKLSNETQIMLRQHEMTEVFADNPDSALTFLRGQLQAGVLQGDDLFALAELSLHRAERGGGKPHFLAAAAYAYAFLFPEPPYAGPDCYDPRLNEAMDLYDRAVIEAFRAPSRTRVVPAAGSYPLPWGTMAVSFDPEQLRWGDRELVRFVPATELEVVGFRNRYRQAGIGAPLAAATVAKGPIPENTFAVGPYVRVPVTLLLRIPDPRAQIVGPTIDARLDLYPATAARATEIGGRQVPLAQEPTAALALSLTEARPWASELGRFLGQVLPVGPSKTMLGGREPHRRGRIPVVFVHGTASNFSVWANMVNDLDTDPEIRERFEFWFFRYDSGQPIIYSAMQLRRALKETVGAMQAVDPDPCLDDMVVIGHSQGGLLTKLTAVHSGDAFWRNLSDKPFEAEKLSDRTRAALQELFFVEPLPFVRRVVFIATPHRGSYLASPDLVRRLAQKLITMPKSLMSLATDFAGTDVIRKANLQTMPTAIDNMSPSHPFILSISKIPVAPGVHAHSIVGVTGRGPNEDLDDGVVKYTSAHLDDVESEIVVRSGHSMQAHPQVVAEIARILHLHLLQSPCPNRAD